MLRSFLSNEENNEAHVDDFWGKKGIDVDNSSDSDDDEDEELRGMVAQLEIEVDEQEDLIKSFRRAVTSRMHVFDKGYEPTREEQQEITDIAKQLFPDYQQTSNFRQSLSRKSSRTLTELGKAILNLKPDTDPLVQGLIGRGGKTVLIQKGEVKYNGERVELIVFNNAFLVNKKRTSVSSGNVISF